MKMTSILLGTAALVASVGLAVAAPSTAHFGKVKHQFKGVNRSLSVLYDQHGTDSGIGIVSQNFESSFDAYDSAAADDFSVSSSAHALEVDATGVYFNGSGPATSENVTFYKNKKGHPGKVVKHGAVTATGADSFGSFTISLPGKGVKLKANKTYWVSVQANLAFGAGGEWGWENQTTAVGNPANWEDPGDGFATGCTTWAVENVCIPDGQGDHMFTIRG